MLIPIPSPISGLASTWKTGFKQPTLTWCKCTNACGNCPVNIMWNPQRHIKHTNAWLNNRTRPTRHHTMLIENTENYSLCTMTKYASKASEHSCQTPNKICPKTTKTLRHLQQDAAIIAFPVRMQQVQYDNGTRLNTYTKETHCHKGTVKASQIRLAA